MILRLIFFFVPISCNLFLFADFGEESSQTDLISHFRVLFKSAFEVTNFEEFGEKGKRCKQVIKENYVDDTKLANLSLGVLISSSSKSKNDVGSFPKCYENNKNFTYFIVSSNSTRKSNLKNYFLFGLCLNKMCDPDPLRAFLYQVNEKVDKIIAIDSVTEAKIFDMAIAKQVLLHPSDVLKLVPFIIIMIQVVFVFFPSLPTKIFSCAFTRGTQGREPRLSEPSADSQSLSNINKKYIYQLKACFSLGENGEELFIFKPSTFNDSGISYIKGIKGISLLFYLFANVFLVLFENPIVMVGEMSKNQFIKSFGFSVIIFFIRSSSRIMLSCSGFSLCYKLMCYLDDKLTFENESESNKGVITEINIEQTSLLFEKNPATLSNWTLFRFMINQLHKLFVAILFFTFYRSSFVILIHFFFSLGPLFEIFIDRVTTRIKYLDMISHIFFVGGFIDAFNEGNPCGFINVFWVLTSEINFYIVTSIMIFICYKKKLSLDYCCIILTLVLIVAKYLFAFLGKYNPLDFYYTSHFRNLSINPLFNYSYYLIGVLFGLVNYSIQKGMTYRDAMKQEKPYLILPISIASLINTNSSNSIVNFFVCSCYIILVIFFGSIFAFVYGWSVDENATTATLLLKIISLCDVEIYVILVHLCIMYLYLKGEGSIYNFFSSKNWVVQNKLYFSFITICTPCVYFILYQSETRIKLSFFSVFFYGLICGFVTFSFASFQYIALESPLKKLTKLIITFREDKRKRKRSENEIALQSKID